MSEFQLHPNLAADTLLVRQMQLSTVLLMNDRRFPWLILVPRRSGVTEIVDLRREDQALLLQEINSAALALRKLCSPDKLNIAALGNVTPQLHVHVIARFHNDAAWPRPVWGAGQPESYSPVDAQNQLASLKALMDVN